MVKARGDEVGSLQGNKELDNNLKMLGRKIAVNSLEAVSFR
jgi:hypothetical protein